MPAVPLPPTIRDEVVPSSEWNQFRDAINFLRSPPRFDLRQTSAQSIPNSSDTPVEFTVADDDADVDGVAGWTVGTPSVWTCRYPGRYLLHGKAAIESNATGIRVVWIAVNGIDVPGSGNTIPGTTAFDPAVLTNPKKVPLQPGDQVQLFTFQNSGGPRNTFVGGGLARYQSTLSGLWVSVR